MGEDTEIPNPEIEKRFERLRDLHSMIWRNEEAIKNLREQIDRMVANIKMYEYGIKELYAEISNIRKEINEM